MRFNHGAECHLSAIDVCSCPQTLTVWVWVVIMVQCPSWPRVVQTRMSIDLLLYCPPARVCSRGGGGTGEWTRIWFPHQRGAHPREFGGTHYSEDHSPGWSPLQWEDVQLNQLGSHFFKATSKELARVYLAHLRHHLYQYIIFASGRPCYNNQLVVITK